MLPFTLLITYTSHDANLAQELMTYILDEFSGLSVVGVRMDELDKREMILQANMALLLLTPAFLLEEATDDSILDELLSRTMEDQFHLYPVILQECEWEDSPYSGLTVLPFERIALNREAAWGSKEKAFTALTQQLQQHIHLQTLQVEDPKAYAQLKAAPVVKKGAFTRHLIKLLWKNTPKPIKWGAGLVLGILLFFILYLISL